MLSLESYIQAIPKVELHVTRAFERAAILR